MDTETVIYPISAVSMTILTVLTQYMLERLGKYDHEEFTPLPAPDKFSWISVAARTAIAALIAFPLLYFGWTFCIAPPLLVAFTEFCAPGSKARSAPFRTVMVITGCALCGAAFRLGLGTWLGFPLTVPAVLAVISALIIMKLSGRYIPPAGALAVLPMIIPEKALLIYPAEILAGASFFMLVSFCFRNNRPVAEK